MKLLTCLIYPLRRLIWILRRPDADPCFVPLCPRAKIAESNRCDPHTKAIAFKLRAACRTRDHKEYARILHWMNGEERQRLFVDRNTDAKALRQLDRSDRGIRLWLGLRLDQKLTPQVPNALSTESTELSTSD